MPSATTISIDAWVPVAPQTAWRAYTTPQDVVQWNHATPEWHCPWANIDLREGGRHVARMEARDGSFGFDYSGTYEAVDEPVRIVLRLDDGRRVETTFEREGEGTRVRIHFESEATHTVEQQRVGWQAILDSYARYVGQLPT
ncbi:MAG: SRPBCC domain-containing protein [Casimicrobiaceae bacterium]|nr:SRPBCC domain-containing protein [Casimicrobiaceae bacterium]MCX8097762.1 SRPBCC domain-containing protein [Casimicrobiaceae bacterium]MDW8312730.1 SRPBCC domain-containing protein [Burkholderiales bacterium]